MMHRHELILERNGVSQLQQAFASLVAPCDNSTATTLSILAIIDKNAYQNSGADAFVEPILNRHRSLRFSDFQPNPKWEDVCRGIQYYHQQPPDLILAVGGGSAIDIAKLVSSLALGSDSKSMIRGQSAVPVRTSKLVAI
ncbi:MAG: phosphonoacetaldehyde reductase, partial [Planctomycetes bacterium]|nr:phosphonoacetaldehyde reductase [Planctomycetota bacterium]